MVTPVVVLSSPAPPHTPPPPPPHTHTYTSRQQASDQGMIQRGARHAHTRIALCVVCAFCMPIATPVACQSAPTGSSRVGAQQPASECTRVQLLCVQTSHRPAVLSDMLCRATRTVSTGHNVCTQPFAQVPLNYRPPGKVWRTLAVCHSGRRGVSTQMHCPAHTRARTRATSTHAHHHRCWRSRLTTDRSQTACMLCWTCYSGTTPQPLSLSTPTQTTAGCSRSGRRKTRCVVCLCLSGESGRGARRLVSTTTCRRRRSHTLHRLRCGERCARGTRWEATLRSTCASRSCRPSRPGRSCCGRLATSALRQVPRLCRCVARVAVSCMRAAAWLTAAAAMCGVVAHAGNSPGPLLASSAAVVARPCLCANAVVSRTLWRWHHWRAARTRARVSARAALGHSAAAPRARRLVRVPWPAAVACCRWARRSPCVRACALCPATPQDIHGRRL
jgi:hypothetical protein